MVSFARNISESLRSTLAREAKVNSVDLLRDLDEQCGYPIDISAEQYQYMYEREGLATRCVSIYSEDSWAQEPEVLESEDEKESAFEKAWVELVERLGLYSKLEEADEISGIGRFGILFFGFNDGKEYTEPVEPSASLEINYIRALSENSVTIKSFVKDMADPRCGLPELYTIKLNDPNVASDISTTYKEYTIHHSRCLHIADNKKGSLVYGTPRLRKVFNRMVDLRKVLGGSAEMFFKGGFPGLSFEVDPKTAAAPGAELDRESLRKEMKKYMEGLERYIATVGVTVKSLAPQIADPMNHVMIQLKVSAICIGVPWRIFAGSEEAKLASTQDTNYYNKKIEKRRKTFCSEGLIRPLVEMLVELKILPEPKVRVIIKFPPLNKRTEAEKAEYAEKATRALSSYVSGNVESVIPEEQYLSHILDLDDDVLAAITKAIEARQGEELDEDEFEDVDDDQEEGEDEQS